MSGLEHAVKMDDVEDARRLLDRIGVLQHPCDLDLLIFFTRHPRALLGSEKLAVLLGYEFKQVAASLDVLQKAGLLELSENPTHMARLYVFATDDSSAAWLPDLLQLAGTREGRLALLQALRRAEPGSRGTPGTGHRKATLQSATDKRRKSGGR